MGISSPGIGSNLDINGIVAKLMQAEAAPLTLLAQKEASYQAKLSAFGTLSGALSSFKDALGKLNNPSTFQSLTATPGDNTVFTASAAAKASAGNYSINVTKLAQAQSLSAAGVASTTAAIGTGKLVFQFGAINGNFSTAGTRLGSGVVSGGIPANSLSINGTTITTGSGTNSAKSLAEQINIASATTGVTATAEPANTGTLGGFATTSAGGSYRLDVGGINIVDDIAGGLTAADIDAAVASKAASLSAQGISYTGSAADGTLAFTRADGANLALQESGTASGGFASIGVGSTKTFTGSVSLSSGNPITVAGGNPSAAGLVAGTFSTYDGATFTQDANQTSGEVTIDSTNNSLQGIRDAINKANVGVTATIVSDGSATPHRLVLTSNKTGAASSMKIEVQGGDPALSDLLTYDPAGTQKMMQTSVAQSAALTVNGIAVTSQTNSVTGAIEGVTLDLARLGSSSLSVKRDTAAVQAAVSGLVKSYNDLASTISKLTGYNADTKQAGVLLGDSSVRTIEAQVRKLLSSTATGSNSSLKSLNQLGVSIDKNGTMSLDSSKLTKAMNENITDVAALFSSIGKATDSLVSFDSASTATKPGTYDVFVTQLATQGKIAGTKDLRLSSTVIDDSNKELALTIDGVSASISLTPGSYSASQIASHLQSAINGASALSKESIAVTVTVDSDGYLNITSNRYGSASKVAVSGNGVSNLMGAPGAAVDGVDVAGTIGGVAASGSGQFLTGAGGSAADGLKLQIAGGAVNASRGTVTFSQGYAFHLNNLVEGFVGTKGLIAGRTDGLKTSIRDLGKMSDSLNERLTAMEKRYRAQFTALDVAISRMNSTSMYLAQQLEQISNLSKQ